MNADRDYLAAGLALGGLSDAEQEQARRLADTDPEFRAEVAAYVDTAALMAESDSPQLVSAEVAEAILAIPDVHDREALISSGSPAETPISLAEAAERRSAKRAGRRRWVTWVAAAACVAAVAGWSVTAWQYQSRQNDLEHSLEAARSELADSQRLLDAPDLRLDTSAMPGGGSITVLSSVDAQLIQVVPRNVSAPPSDKSLQLWVIGDDGPLSAGLLTADATSIADLTFATGSLLGITVEPAGGSPQPTASPIVAVTL